MRDIRLHGGHIAAQGGEGTKAPEQHTNECDYAEPAGLTERVRDKSSDSQAKKWCKFDSGSAIEVAEEFAGFPAIFADFLWVLCGRKLLTQRSQRIS